MSETKVCACEEKYVPQFLVYDPLETLKVSKQTQVVLEKMSTLVNHMEFNHPYVDFIMPYGLRALINEQESDKNIAEYSSVAFSVGSVPGTCRELSIIAWLIALVVNLPDVKVNVVTSYREASWRMIDRFHETARAIGVGDEFKDRKRMFSEMDYSSKPLCADPRELVVDFRRLRSDDVHVFMRIPRVWASETN